eukprot:1181933-Prorocentrum_minimum.AAC.4
MSRISRIGVSNILGFWDSCDEAVPAVRGVHGVKETLAEEAMVWCAQEGVLMGVGGGAPSSHLSHAPVSLLPSAFPKQGFMQYTPRRVRKLISLLHARPGVYPENIPALPASDCSIMRL